MGGGELEAIDPLGAALVLRRGAAGVVGEGGIAAGGVAEIGERQRGEDGIVVAAGAEPARRGQIRRRCALDGGARSIEGLERQQVAKV